MKTVPDIMGLQLSCAESILKESGIQYRIEETTPPPGRRQLQPEQVRVIRQSSENGTEVLLVCRI